MSTRYGFSLKLDCDNAEFEEDRSATVARILRNLADRIERGGGDYCATINNRGVASGALFDANGNRCGAWEAKSRRLRD